MDLDNLIKDSLRGTLSAELLEHLKTLLEECKAQIYKRWQQCSLEEWGHLRAMLEAVKMLENKLLSDIANKKMADEKLLEAKQ